MELRVEGVFASNQVVLYTSSDLVNWLPIQTNPATVGALLFIDPDVTNSPVRFYRVEEEESQRSLGAGIG
jgi:hypothetical protein